MSGTGSTTGSRASEVVNAGYLALESTAITTTASYVDVDFVTKDGTAITNDAIDTSRFISLEIAVDPGTTQTTLVKAFEKATPNAPEVELLAETTVASDTPTTVYTSTCRGGRLVIQVKQGDGSVSDAAVYVMLK